MEKEQRFAAYCFVFRVPVDGVSFLSVVQTAAVPALYHRTLDGVALFVQIIVMRSLTPK